MYGWKVFNMILLPVISEKKKVEKKTHIKVEFLSCTIPFFVAI